MTSNEKAALLEERLIDFAVRIVKVADAMPNSTGGSHFSKQLVRSGTSPALNYGEARSAESSRDFRHKMSIIAKELRETHINMRIIEKLEYLKANTMPLIIDENNQLISIFVSAIKSTDDKIRKQK